MPRGGCRPGAGRPRLSNKQIDLHGGAERPPKPPTHGQLSRREDLQRLYAFFAEFSRRLIEGPKSPAIFREIRHQASLLMMLDSKLEHLERLEADAAVKEPDAFEEFVQ